LLGYITIIKELQRSDRQPIEKNKFVCDLLI